MKEIIKVKFNGKVKIGELVYIKNGVAYPCKKNTKRIDGFINKNNEISFERKKPINEINIYE